jgi:hypothetical protein
MYCVPIQLETGSGRKGAAGGEKKQRSARKRNNLAQAGREGDGLLGRRVLGPVRVAGELRSLRHGRGSPSEV